MRKPDPRPYLNDIKDCIVRIKTYIQGESLVSFLQNEPLKDAVVRRLQIIGDAISRLPDQFKERYPYIPWRDIKDMRNKLVHDYGYVDYELVWAVIQKELPELEQQIDEILLQYG